MKRCTCLLFLILTVSSYAQQPGEVSPTAISLKADGLLPFHDGFAIITRGTETALINNKTAFSIPYGKFFRLNYEDGTGFDGRIIRLDKYFGFWDAITYAREQALIDSSGKQLFTLKHPRSFEAMSHGLGGLQISVVTPDGMHYKNINWLWFNRSGFIKNLEGIREVKLGEDDIVTYSDKTNVNKKGFRYLNGTIITPPIYDLADVFYDGLAAVAKKDPFGEMKWGFIDKKGTVVIPLSYSIQPGNFGNGLACVIPKTVTDFKFAFINKKGDIVLKIPVDHPFQLLDPYRNGNYYSGKPVVFKNGLMLGKAGYMSEDAFMDTTGKVITLKEMLGSAISKDAYVQLLEVRDNQLIFETTEGYRKNQGVMDLKTKKIIPPVFTKITTFDPASGLAYAVFPVQDKTGNAQREGYINRDGIFVIVKAAPDNF